MEYEKTEHGEFKKTGDIIIDKFIKWLIFNPNAFCIFVMLMSLYIVIQIYVCVSFFNNPIICISFQFTLVIIIIGIIYFFNATNVGKKLYETDRYCVTDMQYKKLLYAKAKTYYQAKYIYSFPEEFN